VFALVTVRLPEKNQAVNSETFTFSLRKDRLRAVRRREGRYLLRTNLDGTDPAGTVRNFVLGAMIMKRSESSHGN
jgi:hypothetical protein